MEIKFSIKKEDVYEEVNKTTSYRGAKMEDAGAYGRVSTTSYDDVMLDRFWDEGQELLIGSMKRFIKSYDTSGGTFSLTLDTSASFDKALQPSMGKSLFSFFVMYITAQWFSLSNQPEAEGYLASAEVHKDDFRRKLFFKKKPVRPEYD